MADLNEILKIAEKFMKQAEDHSANGDNSRINDRAQTYYLAAVHSGIRALYEQNNVIIQLLRERKTE